MKKFFFAALCLVATGLVTAQEIQIASQLDSVIIDSKIQRPRKNSGKVVASITAETLANSPGKSVAELITEVSGIEINGARSNDGQNLSYFVRGGRSRQVVILIDGVQQTDPSSISNEYDLRLVPASSVAGIEIVKGASSVLYGSGAGTAVISITTKQASKAPISGTFSSTMGSNSASGRDDKKYQLAEFTNYATINGTLNTLYYNLDFSHRYVDGLSAVAAPEGEDLFEADIFNRFNSKLNLGYKISEDIQISQFVSFEKFKADFDDFSYFDAENQSITQQFRTGGHFEWKFNKGMYVFNDSYTWIERDIISSFPAKYDAKTYALDSYATYAINLNFTALLGLNYVNSSFNSFSIPFGADTFSQDVDSETASFNIIDPYLNLVYTTNFGLNINAGARLNNHSNYGAHFVYNVNPSYNFELGDSNLKLLASYSTAYITPSLFQLYDPIYGNSELEPEENTTIEAGVAFTDDNNLRASVVYFNRAENNFVDFVTVDPDLFIFQYQNVGAEFSASGIEVEVSKKFGIGLYVSANYTNTQPDVQFALRIPEHKANATIGYALGTKSRLGLSYNFVGEREDSFFNSDTFESEDITLESYGLLGFSAATEISKNLKLFASVSNLLDEEYEELYRFQTKGRNFRLGFTLLF